MIHRRIVCQIPSRVPQTISRTWSSNNHGGKQPGQQLEQRQAGPHQGRRRQGFGPWLDSPFGEVFDHPWFFNEPSFSRQKPGSVARSQVDWTPKVDISDTEKQLNIHFELPGLKMLIVKRFKPNIKMEY